MMKLNKKLISLLAVLALLVTLGCGAMIAAAAETSLVKLSLSSMEDGLTVINVSLNGTEKPVDYVQLDFDSMDAAATPSKYESAVDNVDVYTGSNTVLAIPVATGVSMAADTTVFTFQVENTANGDVLNYSGTYILCYTDGTSAEGSFSASITVKGNLTSRLEAETDSIYWQYGNVETGGLGTEVGGIYDKSQPDSYRLSFEELKNGTPLRKAAHPMMSFIVNVAEEGDYSLDVVFRGAMTTGSFNDYFMALCVDDEASSYVKATYKSVHPDNSSYHIVSGTVHLEEGQHVVRVITMLADTRSDTLKLKWLNIDYVEAKGPGVLTPVAPQWTHLNSNKASTIVNFADTTATALTGNSNAYAHLQDWWANPLGGYRGDNNLTTSEGFTLDSLSKLGYFAYTVNVPADGYYDLQTYIDCNRTKTIKGNLIMIVDDEIHKFPAISPQSNFDGTIYADMVKWNAQNLSCYLTKGTHTIVVSGIIDQDQTISNWCNVGSLSVSGGITIEGVTQIAPQSISITKTGNTLLLESMVQNKYQFSVEGVTIAANENNSGLLVWRGEKLAAANGVYEFGTQSYVVNNLSAADGTIKALGIAAKEQGDDIVARGFVMDANGKYYYSEVIDFNATAYASAVFAADADTSLVLARPTVAAMLNYFGKAQKLFDHAGNGYMDEIEIPTGIDLTYDASYRIALEATPEHFTSDTYTETIYHSLELEDNVYIKYIVPKGSKTSAPTLLIWEQGEAITLDNATQMPMGVNGSYYTASITGIAPKDMGKTFFVSVYDATTGKYSQLDAYSIHQYAGNMITKYAEDSSQTELVDLCKALLTYSHMAKNYFASLNADVVYVSNAGTVYNSGATAADATDWESALYKVKDGGTLYMVDYVMAADETWPAHTKSVTLQGSLNASAQTTLNINGPTTFGAANTYGWEKMTLTLADLAEIYANGYKVMINESSYTTISANTASGSAPYIFGGGTAGVHVVDTDLTVLTGTWSGIYGGGGGAGSTPSNVTGKANLFVGGDVNTGIDVSNHDQIYNIFGGSRRGNVAAINVTVGGSARAIQVYGGGSGSSTADWCDFGTVNVTVQDNARLMGVHGGNSYGAGNNSVSTINITINGGEIDQIFGGHRLSDSRTEAKWGVDLNGDGDTEDDLSVNLIADINIYLNGGTINRRVIGGSYNDYGTSGWTSSKRVKGNITLTISDAVTLNMSDSYSDYGIIAGSRHANNFAEEKTTVIFTNSSARSKHFGKLGLKGVVLITITLVEAENSCDNYSSLSSGNLQ